MHVIGVDIGGTTIKAVLVNQDMEPLQERAIPTEALGKEAILKSLREMFDHLIPKSPSPLVSIGIGSAGRINIQTGEVVYATDNLPGWHGFPLKSWVEEHYQIPTIVDNDANMALLGELYFNGTLQANQNTVMLTLGTGVGGANYFFGQVVRGAHHQSGEWGHLVLYPDGKPCNCGKSGCIEQYVSGTALRKAAEIKTGRYFSHGREVFEQMSTNQAIQGIVAQFVDDLALIIENLSISLDPDRIILGGGVVDSSPYWWGELIEKLTLRGVETTVMKAMKMNKAGMYGAAYVALQNGKEVRKRHETS